MTCREKLAIEHPECVNPSYSGGCYNCPLDYGYLDDRPEYCSGFGHHHNANHECDRCWDREIPKKESETFHDEPEKKSETFHEKLVRTIKDVGQEIINNAEDYAGTSPYISRMTITINFDPENGMGGMLTPEINVDKTYLCGATVKRIREECKL